MVENKFNLTIQLELFLSQKKLTMNVYNLFKCFRIKIKNKIQIVTDNK